MARTKKKKPYEIGELDQYLFGQGTHYDLNGITSCHGRKEEGHLLCGMGSECKVCLGGW